MSPASLSMLEKLMSAQAQECVFEGLLLQAPGAAHDCLAQLRLAQEAAQVRAGGRGAAGGGCPRGRARLRLLALGCSLSWGPGQGGAGPGGAAGESLEASCPHRLWGAVQGPGALSPHVWGDANQGRD